MHTVSGFEKTFGVFYMKKCEYYVRRSKIKIVKVFLCTLLISSFKFERKKIISKKFGKKWHLNP